MLTSFALDASDVDGPPDAPEASPLLGAPAAVPASCASCFERAHALFETLGSREIFLNSRVKSFESADEDGDDGAVVDVCGASERDD